MASEWVVFRTRCRVALTVGVADPADGDFADSPTVVVPSRLVEFFVATAIEVRV